MFINILFDAIVNGEDIKINDKIIHITPKLTKIDFFESLKDWGKESEKEYFEYFGLTPISLRLYPTVKNIKEKYGISYNELSEIGKLDLIKRLGHSPIQTTLEYYKDCSNKINKEDKSKICKDAPTSDYLEFMIWFGDNKELYNKLKYLREEEKCSWKEIKNLKYGDIDFENSEINIEKDEIDIC